jgi:hypothetical protein
MDAGKTGNEGGEGGGRVQRVTRRLQRLAGGAKEVGNWEKIGAHMHHSILFNLLTKCLPHHRKTSTSYVNHSPHIISIYTNLHIYMN